MIDLTKCRCQEANMRGELIPGTGEPMPCGRPGARVVFHQNDGRNVYVMCEPCASHNLKNRGGVELVEKGEVS